MKKTAVDFLSEKYMYVTWLRNRDEISAEQADKMRAQYLEEAKEMEKEQMINSYLAGKWDEKFTDRKSEEFYEQIYEKK
jgi:hypothetical protein